MSHRSIQSKLTIRRVTRFALPMLLVAMTGCGDEMGSGGSSLPEGPDAETPAGVFAIENFNRPEACSSIGGLPSEGDLVIVEGDADTSTVAFGGFSLVGTGPDSFTGCETGELDANGETLSYRRSELNLTQTPSGYDAALTLDYVLSKVKHPCDGVTFSLRQLTTCEPSGSYQMTSSPVVTGSCDLSWTPTEVSIEFNEDSTASIQWDNSSFEEAAFDQNACTLSAAEGLTEDSLYFYNGAARQIDMTLTFEGLTATATIRDSLDGPTNTGEECEGATFEVPLQRVTGIVDDVETQPFECAAERPPVCGDQVCEKSENCSTCLEDCGCQAGSECVFGETPTCRTPCEDVTVPGQCGEGQRCGLIDEPGFAIRPSLANYCQPSLGFAEGVACTALSDCADGLICHRSTNFVSSAIGVCSRPCGTCDDGFACQNPSDGTNSGSFLTMPKGCGRHCDLFDESSCPEDDLVCSAQGSRLATCVGAATSTEGVGADCTEDACLPGLTCIITTVGDRSEQLCRMPCDVDSDCASVGGRCQSVGGRFGACI